MWLSPSIMRNLFATSLLLVPHSMIAPASAGSAEESSKLTQCREFTNTQTFCGDQAYIVGGDFANTDENYTCESDEGEFFKLCYDFDGTDLDFESKPVFCVLNPEENYNSYTFDVNTYAGDSKFAFPDNIEIASCSAGQGDNSWSEFQTYKDSLLANSHTLYVCPTTTACPNTFSNGQRKLLTGHTYQGTEPMALDILKDCGDYEYEAFLHVTDHLSGLLIPSKEAQQAGCPFGAAHSVITSTGSTLARKEVKVWSEKGAFEEAYHPAHSLSIGTFALNDFAQAYYQADAGNNGIGAYDVIKNNCGAFIVSLGNQLGIKIDSKITAFVVRRLAETAGQSLIQNIRKSPFFPSFMEGLGRRLRGDAFEDSKLLEILVEKSATGVIDNEA